MFLRNHDELTLEMVTDEERDYMYRAYAHDSEMRINLGIRRRLAPLVGNDRRKMELLNGLLFSLPGTPVLYYGDEIGMGDNVFLGDRNGVRTPMQWSADRNAGFSRANPQRLILPIIIDPEYHYEAINVEAQQNNPNSLLWWTKRLIALRKRFQAFGRGTIEFLTPANYRVLAFVRELRDGTTRRGDRPGRREPVALPAVRRARPVEVEGDAPVELFGHTEFPPIGELPYLLTLGGHEFYWFSLEPPPSGEGEEEAAAYVPPVLAGKSAHSLLVGRRTGDDRGRAGRLPGDAPLVRRARSPRDRRSTSKRRSSLGGVYVLVARVEYADREAERYVLPLATVTETRYVAPHAAVAHAAAARRRGAARRRDGGRRRRRARCWRPSSRARARRASAAPSRRCRSPSSKPPRESPPTSAPSTRRRRSATATATC